MRRFFYIIMTAVMLASCHSPEGGSPHVKAGDPDSLLYLNHADSAKYVGINTCLLCHQEIYNTFIKTGMGRSFDLATKQKSAADFSEALVYDKYSDFYYRAFWQRDSLHMMEFRMQGKDTVFKRTEMVNYIIGSGQHTNSHIQNVNGYLNQMPMTFYTQKHHWDLPPGFENGMNSHFSRKIGLECMSCHNAFPDFVLGSENKFTSVPQGINCERCHGPGSIHVAQRSSGSKIDTGKYIDYSIVNPAKLPIDAQFDICQRCHLQGNAVLKPGKSFYDFRPGMKLSDYITVFLPKYEHADDEFIMASHADRLKQSQCFIKSFEKAKNSRSLKPYKDALTCVTCHNPHVSVRETNKEVFNDACRNCHGQSDLKTCSEPSVVKTFLKTSDMHFQKNANCVSCHMPASGATDIPHVSVHDHYIRKPLTKKDKQALKTFIGLYAINEKNPARIVKAQAYLNQYEKFDRKPEYLDSAAFYIQDDQAHLEKNIRPLVQLYFIRQDYNRVIKYVENLGKDKVYDALLVKRSYSNDDAWAAYHIAEAYGHTGNLPEAIRWFKKSVTLAPYYMEFKNKLATAYATNRQLPEADKEFSALLAEYPKHVSALTNLGFIRLTQGKAAECEQLYKKALGLDPDYEPLLMNLAGLYAYKKDMAGATAVLRNILKKNPDNRQAQQALRQLGAGL